MIDQQVMSDRKKNILIKILVEISRVILGGTFLFSGFVKAVDPYGFAYKIEDYLSAFGLSSLSFLALPVSAFLCALEFLMGAFMLLGIYRRWNSRLMFVVMSFMTLLTLYLAIANPVEDCGCFGDAFIISNWHTFYKNIVLMLCAVCVLIYRERIGNFFTGKTYWIAFLYIIFFAFAFIFRNYYYDPLFDFRPYTIGANLPELMATDPGKGRVEKNILVYEKDGVQQQFTEDNYPWEDTTWVFVKMETQVEHEGEKAAIQDFTINKLRFNASFTEMLDQIDITERVLSDSNYVFLMISPSLNNMSTTYLSNFEDVAHYGNDNHYGFYCLTASTSDDIIEWEGDQVSNFNFCHTDERTLKTIIRTNPGLLLLKNGVIVNKWADVNVPTEKELIRPLEELSYSQMVDQKSENKKNLFYICAIFVLPLFLLKIADFLVYRNRGGSLLVDNEPEKTED